ncbi:interleukin-17 receptor A isoform X2 [Sardina pilchardus]|uniref:interleukin-17 receptor A isoform X2 n=1 Tax=Sardina pilchardus TaxID=27697 RepID=UPI002E15B5C2
MRQDLGGTAQLAISLRILQKPVHCVQEGLNCTVHINNCPSKGWIQSDIMEVPTEFSYDPGLKWATQRDEHGSLVPILLLHWRAPSDGSITKMQGSEVTVLEKCTNQTICIRYIFSNTLTSSVNGNHNPWSFSSDIVVVDPGCQYSISFSYLPKLKKRGERDFQGTLTKDISIPDCNNSSIKESAECVKRGSLWQPNITWTESQSFNQLVILISFEKWTYSENYKVEISGRTFHDSHNIQKANQKRLSTNFTLNLLSLTQSNESCLLPIGVTPFSEQCIRHCVDHWDKINICNYTSLPPRKRLAWIIPVQLLVVLTGGYLVVLLHRCFHGDVSPSISISPKTDQLESIPMRTQRVLILYSVDHPLYKEIILKLCAFLRVKCGAEVTLDLLDSAWLSTIGKVQWLEMHRERAGRSPSDKILILCSRGVAAKWRAMCGSGRAVTLREDQASAVGDMLTPALALIVPDFVRSASLERYMVAYFEEVSGEADVPSLFHVTVKYKLMKHFEELVFRILGQEQHEPGRVKRIYGIAEDDYFLCPTGKALRDAIEAFQAYQLGNPDWFNQELVGYTGEKDIDRDCEPLVESVCSHIQEVPDIEGSFLHTNMELNQAVSYASSNKENTCVYPSVNELVLGVSPETTQCQVYLKDNYC